MATSSANPFKLSSYATAGLELVATLTTTSTSVGSALDTLRLSSSPHLPALGDADATLADTAGDWFHLDEFAGDVANAFFQANQHLMDRPLGADRTDSMVLSLDDASLLRLGHVGYADRDVAIAEAHRLADDLQNALDDGDLSADEMAALSDQVVRGQHDPAFSVALVEDMGVDGMARVPALIEAAWPGGEHADNPGWGQEQLLPFATLLGTAMDTRAATRDIDRHDPDNQDLADGDRLSEAWVDEFTSFWQPDDFEYPNNFHYSLLVKGADLPTDVLVDVADRQLDYLLAHDATATSYMHGVPWGYEDSTAEVNILGALGDNRDASLQWLDQKSPGDGTLGYPGRTATNLEMLLRYDPNMANDPMMGDALATVVDNGLQHWDDRADDLFEVAVDTVGDQDSVHFDALVPVLGEGARTHMDQLAARTNEVLPVTAGQSDQAGLQPLHNAHDFLKVLMEDDRAANSVYMGGLEYVQDRFTADTGDGFGGESRAIGGLMGLITEADENAAVEVTEERIASRESFVKGTNLLKDVAGLTPVGTAARAAAVGFYHLNNFGVPGADGLDVNADYANIENVRAGIRAELTSATAAYEYGISGTWTSTQVTDAATAALGDPAGTDTDFFVDGTSGDQRPIKPYGEMSADEQRAYTAWLNSDQVGDAIAGERTASGQRMDEVIDSLEHR
jgi:hypothetical protein